MYALIQLGTTRLVTTPTLQAIVRKSLNAVKGSPEFRDLVAKYKIKDQNAELLNIAVTNKKLTSRRLPFC